MKGTRWLSAALALTMTVSLSAAPAAAATFTDKDLNTVKGEFAAMPAATEVFELPGAGYITGSNGTYSNPPTGGFYWSSSLDGSGKVYRAEIQEGHVNMTEPYASRASGHSIRCVRQ